VNGINGSSSTTGKDSNQGDMEDEEREVERPRSPVEESDEWLEVGQKGKTNFTRTVSADVRRPKVLVNAL